MKAPAAICGPAADSLDYHRLAQTLTCLQGRQVGHAVGITKNSYLAPLRVNSDSFTRRALLRRSEQNEDLANIGDHGSAGIALRGEPFLRGRIERDLYSGTSPVSCYDEWLGIKQQMRLAALDPVADFLGDAVAQPSE
jgi:hypothetical protein